MMRRIFAPIQGGGKRRNGVYADWRQHSSGAKRQASCNF